MTLRSRIMEIQSQSAVATQAVVVQGNSAAAVKTAAPAATAKAAVQTAPVAAPDRKALEEAVRDMEKMINVTEPPQLQFSIDETTAKTVVRVTDASTGELIRQLPSEEALAIARSLDKMQGLLLKQQA
ncbi:MAG: flagellar protein FlaG [Rhodocyclaceae bacterium]|nr:flagellar protein FlaG [Rhodocyclaceae bacterium]